MDSNSPSDFQSCEQRQHLLVEQFNSSSAADHYKKIIEFGKEQTPLSSEKKSPNNLVKGCQSQLYLSSTFKEGKIYFEAYSDALISAGLAQLLLQVYSGEKPEVILKCPPSFLDKLNIFSSLSPSRANGLSSLFLRMKQDALTYLVSSTTNQ